MPAVDAVYRSHPKPGDEQEVPAGRTSPPRRTDRTRGRPQGPYRKGPRKEEEHKGPRRNILTRPNDSKRRLVKNVLYNMRGNERGPAMSLWSVITLKEKKDMLENEAEELDLKKEIRDKALPLGLEMTSFINEYMNNKPYNDLRALADKVSPFKKRAEELEEMGKRCAGTKAGWLYSNAARIIKLALRLM